MVVDDHPDHRNLLRNILEPLGFKVREAADGGEAIECVSKSNPELILLDLNMPGLDGYETAYWLRSHHILTPIIVLTADAYPADRVKAINAGCNDFLVKPIDVLELLAKIQLQLGLDWHYQGYVMERILDAHQGVNLTVPAVEILKDLEQWVRIGDLQGLNRYLIDREDIKAEYPDFYRQIEMLSKGFRLAELKKLLHQHLPDSHHDY